MCSDSPYSDPIYFPHLSHLDNFKAALPYSWSMNPTNDSEAITLEQLKGCWNEVLDRVLDQDRIAWLAFFDARLVSLTPQALTITFSDVTKFGGEHNFSIARNPKHIAILQSAILEVTATELEIVEE
jgi:hypothetical protein